jgi:5'-nucleotidase
MESGGTMSRPTLVAFVVLTLLSSCTSDADGPNIDGQDIQLTLIHTTDIHSRLIPYGLQVGEVDARLGLAQELEPFGGAARMAYIIDRERGRAGRSVLIDTGDVSQGAPIYNFYSGEPEMRYHNATSLDVMVMGNHEFDLGGINLYNQLSNWAMFPVLSANYIWEDPEQSHNSHLGEVSVPYIIVNAQGLRVGIIGMANLSSMNSIYDSNNRLGIIPLDMVDSCQYFVDMVRPLVDLVVVVSHLGLRADEELIEQVSDIDVVLGGHHHVVLNPPKVIEDPLGRHVAMAHSGAFAKYVGRFDLIVRQCDRIPACVERYGQQGREPPSNEWEVVSSQYRVFPVDSTIPEDSFVADQLEEYVDGMNEAIDLNLLIGYAPNMVRRFGTTGGDSQLGNLVATSMRLRQGVQTDFALSNTLGIRADFVPGPVSVEQMFNVFPFENTITVLQLSAPELQEMFDFITQRSAERGCATQAQIAGAAVIMNCGDVCPPEHRTAGGCNVTPEPMLQRALIGEAAEQPSDACLNVLRDFNQCCDEVVRCGCSDAECLESTCEDRARASSPSCEEAFEPFYRTDPCPSGAAGDAECMGRHALQRCFVPQGQTYGSCYWAVVDDYQIVDPTGSYSLAANDYIARGGSGFRVLGRNTTQENLGISLRDAAMDYIRAGPPCTDNAACTLDSDCSDGQICACDAMSDWDSGASTCSWNRREEPSAPICTGGTGHCILAACADDVTEFRAARVRPCDGAANDAARDRCLCNHRRWALNECQVLSCIDAQLGALSDGRQTMVAP